MTRTICALTVMMALGCTGPGEGGGGSALSTPNDPNEGGDCQLVCSPYDPSACETICAVPSDAGPPPPLPEDPYGGGDPGDPGDCSRGCPADAGVEAPPLPDDPYALGPTGRAVSGHRAS